MRRRISQLLSESVSGTDAWTLAVYQRPDGTMPYVTFNESLGLAQRAALDLAVNLILKRQGHNVCSSEWGKNLGAGLYEFRVRRSLRTICREAGVELPQVSDQDSKVLLRVFFAVEGAKIVLLLCGYDKGADVSAKRQDKEIQRARKLLKEARQRQRRRSAAD